MLENSAFFTSLKFPLKNLENLHRTYIKIRYCFSQVWAGLCFTFYRLQLKIKQLKFKRVAKRLHFTSIWIVGITEIIIHTHKNTWKLQCSSSTKSKSIDFTILWMLYEWKERLFMFWLQTNAFWFPCPRRQKGI